MKLIRLLLFFLFYFVVTLFSQQANACIAKNVKTCFSQSLKTSEFDNETFIIADSFSTEIDEGFGNNKTIGDVRSILYEFKKSNLECSAEIKWLGLLYLKEKGELRYLHSGRILALKNQKFFNNPELVDAWKGLHELNPKSFIKTDVARLEIFHKLSPGNQKLIAQFTDVDANSTLAKFLDDCDADFLKFVNDPENALEVKGFLAHKKDLLTADENRLIAEMLENADEIPNQKVREWLEYGDNMAIFKANREAGNKFGNLMKTQFADVTSEAYQSLRKHLDGLKLNLDDYSIYSQVQLCLKGDCISKGNYWIPDFILVAERTDAITRTKYLEVIVVDAKLSGSTGWTKNQNVAKGMRGWSVKASPNSNSLVKGKSIQALQKDATIRRNGEFIKLYQEGGNILAN